MPKTNESHNKDNDSIEKEMRLITEEFNSDVSDVDDTLTESYVPETPAPLRITAGAAKNSHKVNGFTN